MSKRAPLPIPDEHWKSRWLVLPRSWDRLHRVSEMDWDDPDLMINGTGTTLCGRRGWMEMPGYGSRLCLPRCKHCCRILGIPEGGGAPFNTDGEWQHA